MDAPAIHRAFASRFGWLRSTNFTDPTYAADHRSATVNVSYRYSLLGGRLMNLHGTRVDTLVKRNGKVLLLASEDHTGGTIGPQ